jgi:AAA domain-containing protein/DnaB helicase-like protein
VSSNETAAGGGATRPRGNGGEGILDVAGVDPTVPPATENEEAVLGSMLQAHDGAEAVAAVSTMLSPSDFTSGPKARLFSAIVDMQRRGVPTDLTLVADELRRRDELEIVGGPLELARLADLVPSGANVLRYASNVIDRARRRRLFRLGDFMKTQAPSLAVPVETIVEELRLALDTAVAAPPVELRWRTAADLKAEVARTASTRAICDGLLVEGQVALIAGAPKAGKSMLVADLLARVERGEPWCGRSTEKATALVLTEEGVLSVEAKVARYGLAGARFFTRSELVELGGGSRRPLDVAVDEAISEAKSCGARVLVVDTFPKWAQLDDENDAASVLAAIPPLDRAAEAGLAVLVVAHARKGSRDARGGAGDAVEDVRGSGALAGAVDLVATLRKADPSSVTATARTLSIVSRLGEPEELALDLVNGRYVAAPSAIEAAAAGHRRRVLDVVRSAAAPMTAEEIRDAARMKKPSATTALAILFAASEVMRSGSGTRWDPYRFDVPGRALPVAGPPLKGWDQGPARNGVAGPGVGTGRDRGPATPLDGAADGAAP